MRAERGHELEETLGGLVVALIAEEEHLDAPSRGKAVDGEGEKREEGGQFFMAGRRG